MSNVTLTYSGLKALHPCDESLERVTALFGGADKWNGRKIGAHEAREAGCTFSDLVWAASAIARSDRDVERRLRLWMADCAAHVLHIYEKSEVSDAPRTAIIATRRFARGEISLSDLDAAGAAARAAAGAAARAAAWAAARVAAGVAAGAAAWAAAGAAAAGAAAAWDAEQRWQFDRLIARFSDVEPDDWPLPERRAA